MNHPRGKATLPQIKVDLKDLKILHELDNDARLPFSQIGKRVGLSESVVRYRIERLQKEGVIKQFMTFIDVEKMGYKFYNVSLRLKHVTEEREQEIIEEVKKIPQVVWLISTSGAYQLLISIITTDIAYFQSIFNKIVKILENEIIEHTLFVVIDGCQMPYPLLPQVKQNTEKVAKITQSKKITLTEFDLQLLQELSVNARITSLELSKKFKKNLGTVSHHLNQLLRSDLVQGFKPLIDMNKIGYNWYLLLFRLKYVEEKEQKKFVEFLKSLSQTFFVVNGVGNWSMQVEVYCKNDQEYRQLMNNIFPKQYSSIIKEVIELRIIKEHKCYFYPVDVASKNIEINTQIYLSEKEKTKQEVE